ncbi:MAG: ROK family protein [Clostridium sp.]|nr:ROK family protein [Clostridium sp.]
MKNCSLGVDIGGTFIKYALVDENYKIIDKWKAETIKFDTKEEFYDYLCNNMKYLESINAIGISAPGVIDEKSNVNSYAAPNVCIMYGTNIVNEVSKRTNKKVSAINDAKSAGLCEFEIGNAKGCKSSAFLIIGTGTGGCVCDKDGVVFGKDGFAGEFHKLPFMNFKTGKLDCMGDYASMTALINIYNSKVSENDILMYGHEVCNKYLNGDNLAKEAVEEWIDNIMVQLILISVFYNPEVICLGGGISEEEWFIKAIRDRYAEKCPEHVEANVITTRIERCKYNNDANILGAIIDVNSK